MSKHGVSKNVEVSFAVNVWLFTLLIFIIDIAQDIGRASVFKIVYDYYPNHMGSVSGVIAAVGPLGGCTLSVVLGLAVDIIGVYSACFMLLYGALALCMMAMYLALQAERQQKSLKEAIDNNF